MATGSGNPDGVTLGYENVKIGMSNKVITVQVKQDKETHVIEINQKTGQVINETILIDEDS